MNDASDLLKRATDPQQYDSDDLSWAGEVNLSSPNRRFLWQQLTPFVSRWNKKDVLEIGAGSGWLLHEALRAGAKSVVGIEPSERNLAFAKKYFPKIPMLQTSLEEFHPTQRFDVAFAIMVFTHISDIRKAFSKLFEMLHTGGELYVMVPEYTYYQTPRAGHERTKFDLSPDEYVISITRNMGTITDIIRRESVYIGAATQAGFTNTESIPIIPTSDLIASKPHYEQFKGQTTGHLLIFKK